MTSRLLAAVFADVDLVHEAGEWAAYIPGTPHAGTGSSDHAAVDDLIAALREYAEDWRDHLRHAPDHLGAGGLVRAVERSTDDWLRRALTASITGADPRSRANDLRHDAAMTAAPESPDASDALSSLVHGRLNSVTFVMDHVQLTFDGMQDQGPLHPVLTCWAWPTLETGGRVLRHGEADYTDALVSLVPSEVLAASAAFGRGVRIELESGVLVLDPTLDELTGPEIAMLRGPEGRLQVWRPGEDEFTDLT